MNYTKSYWILSSIEHLQTCYLGIVAHATNHFIVNLPLKYLLLMCDLLKINVSNNLQIIQ